MNCPDCSTELYADVDISGGCTCRGDDEYCYCPSKDVEVWMRCGGYKTLASKKNTLCRYSKRVITDRDSLERFFTKNYAPGLNEKV